MKDALESERSVSRAVVLAPEEKVGEWLVATGEGTWGGLDPVAASDAARCLATQKPARATIEAGGQPLDVFVQVHPPRHKLIIVGAVHVAVPLVRFARELGFRTYVVDPRTVFATEERFGHADEVLTDWPDEALRKIGLNEASYLALLSHDLKLDVSALKEALPSSARYIGALGSRKTHARRCEAMREEGFGEDALAGIHNPIGLDLGGRRAEEMAVSILAEMVAVRHGRDVRRSAGS
jgi:xanthine dehydrogenase accessory factor